MNRFLRENAGRIFVVAALAGLYTVARPPELSAGDRAALANRFRFAAVAMPEVPGAASATVRPVNPSFSHISAWISAVGAAVALTDLDGDGLPNDVCYVDTRTNRVNIAPAPDSGARYRPFSLDFSGIRFDATMAPMGCLPGSFAETGRTDLLIYFWGRAPVMFVQMPGTGPLEPARFKPVEIVPGTERWYTNAAATADIDGDGHLDVILGNYFPDGARVLDANAAEPDVMQHSMSRAFNGAGARLLLWTGAAQGGQPTASFRDASDAFPADTRHGWTLAVGAADLDGDLLPELYLGNDFGPDRMLHNRSKPGHPAFVEVVGKRGFFVPRSKTVGHDSYKGMGVDFADLSCRGELDLMVSNITTEYALEESNFLFRHTGDPTAFARGIAPYVDDSEAMGLSRSGWAWDVKFGDFDNAGGYQAMQAVGFLKGTVNRWPELQELAMANDQLLHNPAAWLRVKPGDDLSGRQRNPFFARSSDGRYYDIASDLAIAEPIEVSPSRGIAVGDVHGDGRMSYAVARQWGPTIFYRNTSSNGNGFLTLNLRLPMAEGTRPAIGATATLHRADGQKCLAGVDGGSGHSGKNAPEIHFGLGQVGAQPQRVTIRWRGPDGKVHETGKSLAPGRHTITLNQGDRS